MNDMKSIFVQVLDTPAPPMTPAEQLLGAAHRAAHRRRMTRISWGAAAAVGLTAVAVTALSAAIAGVDPDGHSTTAPAATRSATGTASPSPSPSATGAPHGTTSPPTGKEPGSRSSSPDEADATADPRYERAEATLGKLINLLPPGYTTPTTRTADAMFDGRIQKVLLQNVQVSDETYVVVTDVYRDGMGGSMALNVDTGSHALKAGGDLCAQDASHQGRDENCHVITTASGVKVRASSRAIEVDGITSRIYYATVFYEGATVRLQENQLGSMAKLKQLAQPIFTESQLAEVVATPDFKP